MPWISGSRSVSGARARVGAPLSHREACLAYTVEVETHVHPAGGGRAMRTAPGVRPSAVSVAARGGLSRRRLRLRRAADDESSHRKPRWVHSVRLLVTQAELALAC